MLLGTLTIFLPLILEVDNFPQPYVSIHPNGTVFLFNNPWIYNSLGEVVGKYRGKYSVSTRATKKEINRWALNRKKRTVHNALHVLSQTHTYRNICFVVTSPIPEINASLIQRFTHNFTNGYHCVNYLWVREYQKNGRPHWHFVADVPFVDFQHLSTWWANLSGNVGGDNSVRLNDEPSRYLDSNFQGCLDYMLKYITKDFTVSSTGRSFAISQDLQRASMPTLCHAGEWWPQNNHKYHWNEINNHVTVGHKINPTIHRPHTTPTEHEQPRNR